MLSSAVFAERKLLCTRKLHRQGIIMRTKDMFSLISRFLSFYLPDDVQIYITFAESGEPERFARLVPSLGLSASQGDTASQVKNKVACILRVT